MRFQLSLLASALALTSMAHASYEPFKINYLNTSQVYYKDLEVKDVKIDNFLCYQEDNNLYKVT